MLAVKLSNYKNQWDDRRKSRERCKTLKEKMKNPKEKMKLKTFWEWSKTDKITFYFTINQNLRLST
jgi:hypothetical protein